MFLLNDIDDMEVIFQCENKECLQNYFLEEDFTFEKFHIGILPLYSHCLKNRKLRKQCSSFLHAGYHIIFLLHNINQFHQKLKSHGIKESCRRSQIIHKIYMVRVAGKFILPPSRLTVAGVKTHFPCKATYLIFGKLLF